MDEIKYKKPLSIEEQVDYLEKNKRVVYNECSKEKAKNILLRYNYINVITPYKHRFAEKDNTGEVIKKNGSHIYNRNISFDEYYKLYKEERLKYPIIAKNVIWFESQFKSILSYHIFNTFHFKNSNDVEMFLNDASSKILLSKLYSESRKANMIKSINNLHTTIENFHDIYCMFDHISLGDALNLYCGLKNNIQNKIFNDCKQFNLNLNTDKTPDFINRVFTLVSVRNCVIHCNSLEILVRFYNPKTKTLRDRNNKRKFTSMINYLSNEKDYTKME